MNPVSGIEKYLKEEALYGAKIISFAKNKDWEGLADFIFEKKGKRAAKKITGYENFRTEDFCPEKIQEIIINELASMNWHQ